MFRLSNVRVSFKVGAIAAVSVLGLLLMGAIFLIGSESQSRHQSLANEATAISSTSRTLLIRLLQLRRHEKDFLLRKDDQYAKVHAETTMQTVGSFDLLKQRLAAMDQGQLVSKVDAAKAGFGIYSKSFLAMIDLAHTLGLTPDTGLEGKLRGTVHEIEASLAGFKDSRLNELMLMMRRHEK